jgi:antitoxin ParD1/3/4
MNMNVSLTDQWADFVESKVSSGRYASSSDVVQEALRLMASRDERDLETLEALRAAWRDGIESGDAGEVDFAGLKIEARRRRAALEK